MPRLTGGEELAGAGSVAAGDTVRWILGDTESESGATQRVHGGLFGGRGAPVSHVDCSFQLGNTPDERRLLGSAHCAGEAAVIGDS
ncbi:hypothetical protein AA101099_1947 [Neoasaia chiangmaiensis NBRC 101099]|nr:hypothetical protein AA101099_1947 [Neoasaia chiangmaiensis NBRC 101099]